MSSMNLQLCGKILLGCAGVCAVGCCAYKLYSSNKSEKAPHSSDSEGVIPNEPAKVEIHSVFFFLKSNCLVSNNISVFRQC